MGDLRLDVVSEKKGTGIEDTSNALRGTKSAQKELAEETAKATEKWRQLGEALKVGGEKLVEFGKESVKLLREQEQADRQLALASGEASEALKKQAEVLERSLGVDAVKTEKMQALLYRFGEAPDKIDGTIRALYDYAAVTGGDALAAAETLTSSVESGRAAFKELGLQYEATGDKSKDLVAITDALAKKVGGAAQSDANSAAGQAKIAAAEFENFQKALAGVFTDASKGTSIVQDLTDALRGMTLAISPDDPREKKLEELMAKELEAADAVKAAREQVAQAAMMPANLVKTSVLDTAKGLDDALKRLHEIQAERRRILHGEELTSENPNGGLTKKAADEAKAKVAAVKEAAKEASDFTAEQDAADEVLRQNNINAKHNADVKAREEEEQQEKELQAKLLELKQEAADKGVEIADEAAQKEEEAWDQAAEGAARTLAEKVGTVLEALASGKKVQASDILATILGVGGTLIGAAVGGPLGATVGSLAGNALGQGVKGLGERYSFHTGGWVDGLPRHHNGTLAQDEHLAVLQSGERVMSRREVANAGGPAGVDAMAKGAGGGMTVNLTTPDVDGFRSYLEGPGGRSFYNAVRTGRGSLRPLFGG